MWSHVSMLVRVVSRSWTKCCKAVAWLRKNGCWVKLVLVYSWCWLLRHRLMVSARKCSEKTKVILKDFLRLAIRRAVEDGENFFLEPFQ